MSIRPLRITSRKLDDNKVALIRNFIKKHYNILRSIYKPSKLKITCKTKNYKHSISKIDISLHAQENGISSPDGILTKLLNSENEFEPYDPIIEYFDKIKGTWKGESHIDRLCNLLTAKDFGDKEQNGYYQARQEKYLKKWLVAAVACSLQKKPNDVALGFIQEEEGTGKTSLCHLFVPGPLKDMMVLSAKNKKEFNMPRAFTENFIVIFDEFLGITSHNAEEFKKTMSQEIIEVKEPYDSFSKRKSRIANAMFTTNNRSGRKKGFLCQGMGYRRFLCIHLEHIDLNAIKNDININQLWAEAYTLLLQEDDYRFTMEDFADFKEYNARYFIETLIVQLIESLYQIPNDRNGKHMQPIDIVKEIKKKKLGTREQLSQLTPEKVGIALKQLGFHKKATRVKGEPRYTYYVHPLY